MDETAPAQPAAEESGSSAPEAPAAEKPQTTAAYSGTSEVIRDGRLREDKAQPGPEAQGSSTGTDKEPKGGEPEGERPADEDPEKAEESKFESRLQKALTKIREKDRAEQEAQAEKDRQTAAEAKAAKDAEYLTQRRELARAAKKGDLEAGEKLIQLDIEYFGVELDRPEAPAKVEAPDPHEHLKRAWAAYCEGLGVDPNDKDFAEVPEAEGREGLTAAALKKTGNEKVIAAVLENPKAEALILKHPAVQKLIEAAKEETQAARDDGFSKGIKAKLDAPKSTDPGTMSESDLDAAYRKNPKDPALAKAWITKERRLGRM